MKYNKCEIIFAILFTIITLGLYFYLFGYADRKVVFLYEHLGLTPFDKLTVGRYWMAGFVISGFLTILYLITCLIIMVFIKSEKISLKKIVPIGLFPTIIGVVIIVLTVGEPKLTFPIAISTAFSFTIGIAIGFSFIDDLIIDFLSTFIYMVFSIGLVPILILFRVIELPEKGILSVNIAILIIVISILGGFGWLLIFYRLFKLNRPKFINVIKGTLLIGYLGIPLLHYLFATPKGIPYITSAENFFAENMILRLSNWILLILILIFADKLTKKRTVPSS